VTTTPTSTGPTAAPPLVASFTRTGALRDEVLVVLADGRSFRWSWPSGGDALPHDLAHLAVESAFRLERGFWGLIAAGIDHAALSRPADHAAPGAGSGLDNAALAHLQQAESIVSVLAPTWSAPAIDDRTAVGVLLGAFARQQAPPARQTNLATVQRARHLLAWCTDRWQSLAPGGHLTVAFPLVEQVPEASATATDRAAGTAAPTGAARAGTRG